MVLVFKGNETEEVMMAEREVADVNKSFTTNAEPFKGTMRDYRDELTAKEMAEEARLRAKGIENPHIKASLDAILG